MGAGSSEAPPALSIAGVSARLGAGYGGPGIGDCGQLGTLELALQTPDGAVLDDRFGAKLTVVAGSIPLAAGDISTLIAPIKNNKVTLTIGDNTSSTVDFTVAVQAVNALGALGEPSAEVHHRQTAGCSVASGLPLGVLALMTARRSRRRLP